MSLIKIDIGSTMSMSIGDEITFKFDYHNFDIIIPIEDHIPYYVQDIKAMQESEDRMVAFEKEFPIKSYERFLFEKFHDMVVKGKIHGFSRIDKFPLIKFDVDISEHRDDKINTILQ